MLGHQDQDSPRKPEKKDLDNCIFLLAFLKQSFAGATIGNLKIDDLAVSLEKLIESAQ
jgi:hypothetical protein